MKKFLSVLALGITCTFLSNARNIAVNTANTTLLLQGDDNGPLSIIYYGDRVDDIKQVYKSYALYESAYPAFGHGNDTRGICALSVRHADGNMSTELVYQSDSQEKIQNATITTISLKDRIYDFYVDVCYKAYDNCDVIETWTVIRNGGKKPVTLLNYASGSLPIRVGDVWISHEHGAWADEAELTEQPLTPGMLEIHDMNGTKNAHQNRPNIMLSLDGKPQENSGRTIGAVLCWNGNFKMSIDTPNKKIHHLVAGINNENSQYILGKGESFTTPALALVYSNEGKGGVSRNYHRWARLNNKVHNGTALRKTLLNSWEGVYFNVTQNGMVELMDGVQALGGELFVMDDGWFGGKYKRSKDNCALGDWVTDREKLPDGVVALEKAARERGLKWGIWIEPEMTNTKSELYEKHPDWVVCYPNRTPITGRGGTQLILDLSNPAVQDFVVKVVDDIMTETPDTYYIKWDCNAEMNNFGSHYLSADKQSHLYVDYHLGLIKVLERVRAKYPDLVIQCCASGGGRANYGVMPYFDEFWVSDNTDAQQRLFMQWGTSMFFPACAMASHVSASPNHQTKREIPLKFRFDVAMTGRLGMEMKPSDLNEKEFEFSRNAFALYKEKIRPVVQQGDLYRIISPYDGKGFCSELFITEEKDHAMFFAYKFEQYRNMFVPRFRFAGLDPEATYVLTELNREPNGASSHWDGNAFKGSFLMNQGIEINLTKQYDSRIIELIKQ